MLASAGVTVAAIIVPWVLSKRIPDTPGSPAALVGITLLWGAGVICLVVTVPAFLAAVSATWPRQDDAGV